MTNQAILEVHTNSLPVSFYSSAAAPKLTDQQLQSAKAAPAAEILVRDAANDPFPLAATVTIIMSPTPVTKGFTLSANNQLQKETNAEIYDGHLLVYRVETLRDFADLLHDLKPNECVSYGISKRGASLLTTNAKWVRDGCPDDATPRTVKEFGWPKGPGILMLDYDAPKDGAASLTKDELFAAVYAACPLLAESDALWMPSTSSEIYNAETDEQLAGIKGQRIYFMLEDASDIPRAGKALLTHLWADGHGRYEVSSSGSMLERGIFDASVWQTNRIDFAGGAMCDAPLEQRRGFPLVVEATHRAVDSRLAIPEPSKKIVEAAERNKSAARALVADEAGDKRTIWVKDRTESIKAKNPTLAPENIARMVDDAIDPDRRQLMGDWQIIVVDDDGIESSVTVTEILDNPEKYHHMLTLDPLEPDYDGRRAVGKLFLSGQPYLNSFAHGGAKFSLSRDLVHDSQILISSRSRNKELFRIGAAMRGRGMDGEEIATELMKRNEQLCVPPLKTDEVLGIAKSVCRYPQGNRLVQIDQPSGQLVRSETAITELSLAQEVAQFHFGAFHYVSESGKWMLLDTVTNVWEVDVTGQVTRWALDQIQRRAEYAAQLIGQGEYEYGQKMLAGIRKTEKSTFINGTLLLLKSLEGVQVNKSDFDANPYIVGFQGGKCVNLQTLTIRDIRPEDKLTKLAGAAYEPNARCPIWEKSILDWSCGDRELAKFLQVWVGYTLSGLTEQQYFPFLFGGGKNGKSVFIDIIKILLNDYSMTMNPESLMLKSGGGGANNDIARLAGARLVTSVELPEGRVFDENLIKQLTGGDKITARYLYRENFEFHPNLKLMVTGNHKPIVKGTDNGFWRRVLMVPFSANMDNPDTGLKQKLLAELSGILNWALEGWRMYQSEGLVIPKVIARESSAYREEMDIVVQWKQQCTAPLAGSEIRANLLYRSFKTWAEENGFFGMNSSAFGRKVSPMVRSRRDGRGMIYLDLQLTH